MGNLSWLKGLISGALLSFITAWLFMFIGQALTGGITSFFGESWLYFSVIPPFAITFTCLGVILHNKRVISNKKFWMISLFSALFVSWYSGTIGAILGEWIVRRSLESLNVKGILVWGTIYAFAFLPLSTPFARLVTGVFYRYINR